MEEQVDARNKGDVAQLGEHLPCKQGVVGSNPFISMKAFLRANGWTARYYAFPNRFYKTCTLKTTH